MTTLWGFEALYSIEKSELKDNSASPYKNEEVAS